MMPCAQSRAVKRAALLLAVACAFTALHGAAAFAKKKNVVKISTATPIIGVPQQRPPGAGQSVTLEPECPAGMLAIGGGFSSFSTGVSTSNTGPIRILHLTLVYESRRASPTSWRTSAVGLQDPGAGAFAIPPGSGPDFTAVVYCRKMKQGLVEAASAGPTVSGTEATSTATATCPRHSTPIAGGFSATPPTGPGLAYPSIFESRPDGMGGWRVSANPWTQSAVGVTSYVYCAHGIRPLVLQSATRPNPGMVSVFCPKRPKHPAVTRALRKKVPYLQATGGGFELPPNTGSTPGTSANYGPADGNGAGFPYRAGSGWAFSGGNFSSTAPPPTASAYCS
jgi:hypothetical protein